MKPLPRHQHAFSDKSFLNEFDLSCKSLAAVKNALEAKDIECAKAALVRHFKVREEPRWIFDLRDGRRGTAPHVWIPTLEREAAPSILIAEKACRNELVISPGLILRFDRRLRWHNRDTCSHYVPGNAFKCCSFMRHLGVAWAATGEGRYAQAFARLTERWHQDWPFQLDEGFTGFAMIFHDATGEKSMPTGQRLFNWLTCLYSGIPFAPEVPVETTFQFIKGLWFAGAAYQYFENSKYHKHNHHIMRTCNVPGVIAMMFPETPRVSRMLDMVRRNMRLHIEGSFLSDGGYIERTTSYAVVTLNMFLANLWLARINRVKLLDKEHISIVQRAAEQMALTVLPSGGLPQIGDGYTAHSSSTRGFLTLLREGTGSVIAAAAMEQIGLNPQLAESLQPATDERKAARAVVLPTALRYPATGIGMVRSGWSSKASALCMTIPDAENTEISHAHDDALSIELQVKGKPFLAQPSGELYLNVNEPQYRGTLHYGWFYSMASKNLVLVEGTLLRSLEWLAAHPQARPPAVTSSLEEEKGRAVIRGNHTGYERYSVQREAICKRSSWEIRDEVVCTEGKRGRKKHILLWHFDYGVEVTQDGSDLIAANDGVTVRIQFQAEHLGRIQLVRNRKWMRPNKTRPDEPLPWVARIRFGGTACDTIATVIALADPASI